MTKTKSACPAADFLRAQADRIEKEHPGARDAVIGFRVPVEPGQPLRIEARVMPKTAPAVAASVLSVASAQTALAFSLAQGRPK